MIDMDPRVLKGKSLELSEQFLLNGTKKAPAFVGTFVPVDVLPQA
jgi:hypothetical protein